MFEEVAGLPLHPLAVHGAVVLVPLLALVVLAYALVPRARAKLAWAVVVLAVAAPASAVVSVLSGEAFADRRGFLDDDGQPVVQALADHQDRGVTTMYLSLAVAVLALALVWVRRRESAGTGRKWLVGGLTVLVAAGAVAALVLVVLTGDSGARQVWEETWRLTS